ncbi:hypothetical protein [Streptomyces sp. NBC_00102]|uniref:hypothetical protein n=1 Tax=Streptomyces sp. NBC_00102 TaxID=2975652 RepID=UPI002256F45E|nr:hypothetical protein [Streptomyces sp. NBC_00102]MCX5400970.1 hypothetical protein [Streptomyces sp. NBC_00102]
MDEEEPPADARDLYQELLDHSGPDAFGAVVAPWLAHAGAGYPAWAARAAESLCREDFRGPADLRRAMSWELYALSRVSDVLLLAHQPPPDPEVEAPWARRTRSLDGWPALGLEQYLHLFTALGLEPFRPTGPFDPFLHEIVEVEQAEDPEEAARVTGTVWPGLWLGPLLFSRAGVRVRAGAHHAERGVADRSPLHWTFLRRHRPTVDLSQGWGGNSQWRTDFRLDHLTPTGRRVNAGGRRDIDDGGENPDPAEALLTPAERRELLLNRCLLRTPENLAALTATGASWAVDLFPYDWRLPAAGNPGRTTG